jgi:hypothetical protein
MTAYQPKYTHLLGKTNIERFALDTQLQELIKKYEDAWEAIKHEGTARHKRLLQVLVQVDAVISYRISKLYNVDFDKPSSQQAAEKIDKTKVFALKAKALQLKMRMNRGVKV